MHGERIVKREVGTETMLIKKTASMIRNYFGQFLNDFFSALTFWVSPESAILICVKTLMMKTALLKKNGTDAEY